MKAYLILLIGLTACTARIDERPVGDSGPTWMDSSPARIDQQPATPTTFHTHKDVFEDAAPAPASCMTYDTCGGSWRGYTCPEGYTPNEGAHCVHGPQGEQSDPVWCCYGSEEP